jgi:hypothetical protein
MRNIEQRLQKLHTFIKDADRVNSSVSSANVGWHIEHSLLVIIKMISALTASDPAQYKWKFNLARAMVFTINKFPRGRGKAPDPVYPKQIERTDFDALFSKTREKIEELKKADPNKFYEHNIFGVLNKKNTFVLLDIHTNHHIQIIEDVLSSLH